TAAEPSVEPSSTTRHSQLSPRPPVEVARALRIRGRSPAPLSTGMTTLMRGCRAPVSDTCATASEASACQADGDRARRMPDFQVLGRAVDGIHVARPAQQTASRNQTRLDGVVGVVVAEGPTPSDDGQVAQGVQLLLDRAHALGVAQAV